MSELPDDNSECEPPDPISNSEVKVLSADGSVGFPHVRVGHCQALYLEEPRTRWVRGFFMGRWKGAPKQLSERAYWYDWDVGPLMEEPRQSQGFET